MPSLWACSLVEVGAKKELRNKEERREKWRALPSPLPHPHFWAIFFTGNHFMIQGSKKTCQLVRDRCIFLSVFFLNFQPVFIQACTSFTVKENKLNTLTAVETVYEEALYFYLQKQVLHQQLRISLSIFHETSFLTEI